MMRNMLVFTLLLTTLIFAAPPISQLLEKIEANRKMTTDIKATVTLTRRRPIRASSSLTFCYRRDSDNSYLIVMTGPESEKGNGYLRVEDNFWMYRQNTRTFQHINRDESIAGSNAKGEDSSAARSQNSDEGVKDANGGERVTEEKLGHIPGIQIRCQGKGQ